MTRTGTHLTVFNATDEVYYYTKRQHLLRSLIWNILLVICSWGAAVSPRPPPTRISFFTLKPRLTPNSLEKKTPLYLYDPHPLNKKWKGQKLFRLAHDYILLFILSSKFSLLCCELPL